METLIADPEMWFWTPWLWALISVSEGEACLESFRNAEALFYESGQCHHNALCLGDFFTQQGMMEAADVQILFIRPVSKQRPLIARHHRSSEVFGWSGWHAVLLWKGFVFDLDYADREAVELGVYFEKMFFAWIAMDYWLQSQAATPAEVQVKAVPYQKYRRATHQGQRVSDFALHIHWIFRDQSIPWTELPGFLLFNAPD